MIVNSLGPKVIKLIGNNCNYSEFLRCTYNNANGIETYNNFLYINGDNLNLKNFISVWNGLDYSGDLNFNISSGCSNIIKIIGNNINASNFASNNILFNLHDSAYPLIYFEGDNINFSNAKINIRQQYSGDIRIVVNATNMTFENSFLNRTCVIYINNNKFVNLAGFFNENVKSQTYGWTSIYVDNIYRFYKQNFFNRYNTTPLSFQVYNRNYAVCYNPNIMLYGNFA